MPHGIAIIVQARLGSSRLPGKVLADVAGVPLLGRLVDRLSRSRAAPLLVVATSTDARDDPIAELCAGREQRFFRGSEGNVLERYVLCAREVKANGVVRVTADNPLVDPRTVDAVVALHEETGADLVDGIHRRALVKGLGCEFVTVEALEIAYAEASDDCHLEHVTTFLKDHTERFDVEKLIAPAELSRADLCVSVDYPEDLEIVRRIYGHFGERTIELTAREIVEFLSDHPEIGGLNRGLHPPLPE